MHTFIGTVLTDREALHAEAVQSIAARAFDQQAQVHPDRAIRP